VENDKGVLRNFTEISWNHDEDLSRKNAKAQSKAVETRQRFAPLRLCARTQLIV
jgi:hypothetical protein